MSESCRRDEAVLVRQHAGAWLRDSDGFRFWCSVAGLDPKLVFTRIDRLSA